MKFGGSSVANAERIRTVAGIVTERLAEQPVLVLSAMGDVTDHLLAAAERALHEGPASVEQSVAFLTKIHEDVIDGLDLGGDETPRLDSGGGVAGVSPAEGVAEGGSSIELRPERGGDFPLLNVSQASLIEEIETLLEELAALIAGISLIRELTPKTKDYLVSFGERLAVRIVAAYFDKTGVRAVPLDAWDAGITSTGDFTAAEPADECGEHIPQAILPLVEAGIVPVVTGFIAKCYADTDDRANPTAGDITTLGRGGSDLTATLIAASCRAKEAQVWKDVDGVLTADPRIVEGARPVEAITYDEAAELAYFGAQVLHPRAMLPCMKTGVPVLVKNSYNPAAKGTRISGGPVKTSQPVRALTTKKNVTLVDIVSTRMLGQSGFLAEVFALFAAHKISVDVIATSEVSISLTIDGDGERGLAEARKSLQRIADVEVKTGKAIVTIIGDVSRSSEILARAFTVCAYLGVTVEMVSQGASKVNVSFIVNGDDAPSVVRALHKGFFEGGYALRANG
jgi:aspartate kinase